MPPTAPPRVVKTRTRDRVCEAACVRFTNGRFQARKHISVLWGSVNLGLYGSEREAAIAAEAFNRLLPPDHVCDLITAWRATQRAIAAGKVRPTVLPKYVFVKGGKFYSRQRKDDPRILGPFRSAALALAAGMDQRASDWRRARNASAASAI